MPGCEPVAWENCSSDFDGALSGVYPVTRRQVHGKELNKTIHGCVLAAQVVTVSWGDGTSQSSAELDVPGIPMPLVLGEAKVFPLSLRETVTTE